MKQTLLLLLGIIFCNANAKSTSGLPDPLNSKPLTVYTLTVFDQVLFYDGYAATVTAPPPPADVIRHRNDLYARKLTDEQLQAFGPQLIMNVTVKASCDNYDRIGNVNLAFVPKGATTYSPNDVQRIELGRFITPFMNKNVSPNQVPYTFNVSNAARIFKDPSITAIYDIWVELEIFGVPYAAQTQISGCAGRNDVFFGTLEFVSETDIIDTDGINYILPLSFKKDLNNYSASGTDVIGQTVRTINFNLPTNVSDASFYLITSNHGANAGGEEYNRRYHYIYLDNSQVLVYRPGSPTCEPFRMYNTQANGIYGATPRTNAEWQSFSNWCPGDVIPIRQISLGNLAAGPHSFKITVPDAQFVDQQGYIPVSLYFQGTLATPLNTIESSRNTFSLFPNPSNNEVNIQSDSEITGTLIYNVLGQEILRSNAGNPIILNAIPNGVYMVKVLFADGGTATKQVIKN
ncbi:peptide-N-glycosidase F-related protein [Flavobacterium sp.]|uniref:peptide-N-glycosidase F-related protein n=1 Tax=Flavobacterium sp. TaxID=239 RepID=UPI002626CAE5|nr:peptide-N-glycosidase F-related protein [Flavobacterium sp.]